MSTLLLRLAGPLQSWGTESCFDTRQTGSFPSKSGIIGLLSAALGRRRNEDLSDLERLNFGLRSDWEGTLIRDYHTAHIPGKENSNVTNRYYLADAVFLVGLEAEDLGFLQNLEEALKKPVWPLYLGRRSCPPTQPLVLGIRDLPIFEALCKEKWQDTEWLEKYREHGGKHPKVSVLLDYDVILSEEKAKLFEDRRTVVRDRPISFNQKNRRFEFRLMKGTGPIITPEELPCTFPE